MRGYLNRPELTAERFVADPFRPGANAYRTGDLARQRPDGTLAFLGRRDGQVKLRGHRIELGEIEAVLGAHPAIERAIVTAREDTPGDVRLVAYHLACADAAPTPADLRAHLGSRLPEFMVPAHLVPLERLPLLPNGKVDRAALPRPGSVAVVAAQAPFVAPADAMQERIAAVWRDVLGVDGVGIHDNFFDLGGHSLLAIQVQRRLRDDLGLPLTLTDMFRFPTVASLAARGASDMVPSDTGLAQSRGSERQARLRQRLGQRLPAERRA